MTITNRSVILGSSSPHRFQLMERLQIPFQCINPEVDETAQKDETAEQLVKRLSEEKALDVAKKAPDSIIIGADQVGELDGRILGKPMTREKGIEQLLFCSGKIVRFYTGVCVLDAISYEKETFVETYDVTYRHLTKEMAESYLNKEDAIYCAGSLSVEGLGITLLSKLSGNDYTALIGLPLIKLSGILQDMI